MAENPFSDRFDALMESTSRLLKSPATDAIQEQWGLFLSDVYRGNAWDLLKAYSEICINQLPDCHTGYLALGIALFNLCEFAKALENLDKALELRPGYLLTLRTKTETLAALERHGESVVCATEALAVVAEMMKKDPESIKHLQDMVELLQWAERWDEAVALIEERLNSCPDDLELIIIQAKALGVAGKGEKSLEVYERAIDIVKALPFSQDQLKELFCLLMNAGFMIMTTLDGQTGEDMVNTAEALMKLNERQAFEFREN